MSALPHSLSVLGHRWQLANGDWRMAAALTQQTGLPPLVAQLLTARGHGSPELASRFLNPTLAGLPNPTAIPHMQTVVLRIVQALNSREPITIFGDYDVDGTCATAMLMQYFAQLGHPVTPYIPDRLTEGYGPNPGAFDRIKATGCKLVITVDTGTMAHAALQHAQDIGLEVIVTDHHPPHGALPPCLAILNPHLADDLTLSTLCGTGVAFYLLMALNKHLRENHLLGDKKEPDLRSYLPFVALATVCDVMQLAGPNRILTHRGLLQMGQWQHAGLKALADAAGAKTDQSEAPNAYTLGFQLGPRLNAAGRIESAHTAIQLLTSTNPSDAARLAGILNTLNADRQTMEKQAVEEATLQAEELMKDNPSVLCVRGPWHAGVVGLVASRLKEKFYRPTFAFAEVAQPDGSMLLKGSARSIDGVDVGAALSSLSELTLSGGGHAMAAGATVEVGKWDAFHQTLQNTVKDQIDTTCTTTNTPLNTLLTPLTTLHASTTAEGLTDTLFNQLNQLAPFGSGNPEPTLAITGAVVTYAKTIGSDGSHIRLRLASGQDCVAFGAGKNDLGPILTNSGGKPLTLAGKLKQNVWNGRTSTELHITDAHQNWQS